jgi:hypothetical protein
MPVDVNQARAVGLLVDQVVLPDLVIERASGHERRSFAGVCVLALWLIARFGEMQAMRRQANSPELLPPELFPKKR